MLRQPQFCVFLSICVGVPVCVCVHLYATLCVHLSICMWLCVCVCVCVTERECILYVCACVFIIYRWLFAFIRQQMCVYGCVFVCFLCHFISICCNVDVCIHNLSGWRGWYYSLSVVAAKHCQMFGVEDALNAQNHDKKKHNCRQRWYVDCLLHHCLDFEYQAHPV